jgi:hypothetical protein
LTQTPEIKPFNIINDEKRKEKHAANQFFSSLLVVGDDHPRDVRRAVIHLNGLHGVVLQLT